MNHDTQAIQPERRTIQVESQDGRNEGEPSKGQRKNSVAEKIREGQKFNRLTALSFVGTNHKYDKLWKFQCECGAFRVLLVSSVTSGNTKSCGSMPCMGKTKHELCHTPEHRAWASIKQRCLCKTSSQYKYYGQRGIGICHEWRTSFESFLNHVGKRPTYKHSIDRINNDGHYEPGNVRWASKAEQANNRRSNRIITLNGESLTLSQWADKLNMPKTAIPNRLILGWSIEKTLTTPFKKRHHAK